LRLSSRHQQERDEVSMRARHIATGMRTMGSRHSCPTTWWNHRTTARLLHKTGCIKCKYCAKFLSSTSLTEKHYTIQNYSLILVTVLFVVLI
jgi:Pyruvate/2-oxoacid:ferredoxin oxidoreductase delta subunit